MSNKNESKAQFTRKVVDNQGTLQVSIPHELAVHIGIERGDKLTFQAEKGDYGKYISAWCEKKQKDNKDKGEP